MVIGHRQGNQKDQARTHKICPLAPNWALIGTIPAFLTLSSLKNVAHISRAFYYKLSRASCKITCAASLSSVPFALAFFNFLSLPLENAVPGRFS